MSEWTSRTLADLISIKHGFAFKGEYFGEDPDGPILVTPGNFAIGGGFKKGKPKSYSGPIIDGFTLSEGDLVVTMTDLSKAADTLGCAGLIPGGRKYLHNQRIGKVEILKPQHLDKKFLYYALRTDSYRHHVVGGATGTTVKHTSPTRIVQYVIPLPPVPEQEAIAVVLGVLDDKIAVNEHIAATASEVARGKFQLLSSSAEEEVAVGDVIELKYGKSMPATRRIAGDIPVFGSGGIGGFHDKALVKGPGIIVGRKGTVGAVYWSEVDFFPIDTTFYVACKSSRTSLEYTYFALKSLGLEHMNSDSAVPGLNRDRAHSLLLRVPSSDAMQEFTAEARALFELQRGREDENRTLAALRDNLLPQLMSGRLRVRDAEKIVEDHA